MDEDFATKILGQRKDTILSLVSALVVIMLFAGANNLINKFVEAPKPSRSAKSKKRDSSDGASPSTSSSNKSSSRSSKKATPRNKVNPFRKLPTLLLGAAGFMIPRLYKMASRNPEFVNGINRVIDGCQEKLREMVVQTATIKDDELLDRIDSVLDGFQLKLLNDLSKAIEQLGQAEAEQDNGKKTG